MYNEFFQLSEMPFAIEPNPRFIMLGEDHLEALATLVYAIDQQEGWALLLGEAGVGKTTLIIALLRELKDQVISAVVTNPRLEPLDFFNLVALELGLEGPFSSKGQFLVALQQMINRCRQEGKTLLLVIDEAHSLSPTMLEELRLLGNLDDSSPRVLNIFLVGQPEILQNLNKPEARGLLQRLRRHYRLKPLSPQETASYVRHRLQAAGGSPSIFDDEALAVVHEITGGNPRLMNSLCDNVMILAFTRDQKKITAALVREAAENDITLGWAPSREKQADVRPSMEADPSSPPPAPAATTAPLEASPEPKVLSDEGLLEKGQAPSSDQSMGPESEKPWEPAGPIEPPKEIAPEPAPAPSQPRRKAKTSPARQGFLSRFAASLSREAPGSLWRRALVLFFLGAMVLGGYGFIKYGGYGFLQRQWWSLRGGKSQALFAPQQATPTTIAPSPKINPGVRDWGPALPAPKPAPDSPGGGRG